MGKELGRELLKLYKQVWRVQRALPVDMQALANTYIRHEFREHYDRADEAQMQRFLQEWRAYVVSVAGTIPKSHSHQPGSHEQEFTMEQLKRMELLERTIKTADTMSSSEYSHSPPASPQRPTPREPSPARTNRQLHTLPLESTSRLAWRASLDIDAISPPLGADPDFANPADKDRRQPTRKTGIVCTIGPASSTPEMIQKLRVAGMNIARLNMSHGTHQDHERVVQLIREAEWKDGMAASHYRPIAIALDTKGPEIRLSKKIQNNEPNVTIEKGQELVVGFGEESSKDFLAVDYQHLGDTVTINSRVYIDDGNLQLLVTAVETVDRIKVRALNAHTVKPGKAVNLPYAKVKLPAVSVKDQEDLRFAARLGLDMVFASFIRTADDVRCIRAILDSCEPTKDPNPHLHRQLPKDIKIIAKIENYHGVKNVDEILAAADGIMVARGDLGVELPPEKVFVAQKMMTARAGILGKPVICATQMLESMTTNPRPTRAEATDVANAVLDGADCVMLSAETASGQYPVEAVELMGAVCLQAEAVIAYQPLFEELRQSQLTGAFDMTETIACSAVNATLHAPSAIAAIIVLTTTGHSARLVAKYRPRVPIIVVTRHAATARSLHLHRGCYPFIYDPRLDSASDPQGGHPETSDTKHADTDTDVGVVKWQRDVDKRFYWAIRQAMQGGGLLLRGDRVVCIQGSRGGVGHTNTMRILVVP